MICLRRALCAGQLVEGGKQGMNEGGNVSYDLRSFNGFVLVYCVKFDATGAAPRLKRRCGNIH